MNQQFSITQYSTLVFDCDGVVLNSNKVKTEAFYKATLPFGEAAAQAMVDYHIAHGGVSRYKKFNYFLDQIAPCYAETMYRAENHPTLSGLLQSYASFVLEGLFSCEIAPGLEVLRKKVANARWLIVSGGDQEELREVFSQREIAKYFDGGIFGSPDTKEEILSRELASGNIQKPALFLGDSKYDYQAANSEGLDFVFLSSWSEVKDWQQFVKEKGVQSTLNINRLTFSA